MSKKVEHIDIKSIKDPSVVKTLNRESLKLLCEDIRQEIIRATSEFGGHLSSNLGVVELTVALHRNFDFPKDKLILDVSHQSYTHKILTGRSLENLNSKDGVSGFMRMDESEYDCYESGHSSTSLSAAEGFAIARDIKKEDFYIVPVIGDGSLVNGLSFEALNHIAGRFGKMIIVINDNDMSISRPVGGLGKFFRRISTARGYNSFKERYKNALEKNAVGRWFYRFSYAIKNGIKRILVPLTLFDNLGFTYMGPYDGHDIKMLDKAFKRAKNATKTVIMHVYTTKGKGYKPAEKDKTGYWHGVTPFDVETGDPKIQHPDFCSWPHLVGDIVKMEMEKHDDALLICPGMAKGSHLEGSFESYPDRCVDVGIAEEHALTMAGASNLAGMHPIVCVYSTFLQRAYDELLHDCARMNVDMTLLIDRAGLVGKDGETHMGIYDEAYLKSIPGTKLYMPSTPQEMRGVIDYSMEKGHGIVGIRYPHTLFKCKDNDGSGIEVKPWVNLQNVKKCNEAVIAVGPKGRELLYALSENGYDGQLTIAIRLLPLPEIEIDEIVKMDKIYIYDSYGTEKGFAESLSAALMNKGFKGTLKVFAVPNTYVQHATISEQEKEFGLDIESVSKQIL